MCPPHPATARLPVTASVAARQAKRGSNYVQVGHRLAEESIPYQCGCQVKQK